MLSSGATTSAIPSSMGPLGMPKITACRLILSNDRGALAFHFSATSRAVVSHSGHNHADGFSPIDFAHGPK